MVTPKHFPIHISEIDFFPVRPNRGLIGFVSFTLNRQFACSNIAVHVAPDGQSYRLVFPLKELPNGAKVHLFRPICRHAGEALRHAVAEKVESLNSMYKSHQDVEKTRKRNEESNET